jgi:fructose-1-phosphate kinase PfkB-like protein
MNAPRVLVVLSGGLPPGLDPGTYARLIAFVHGRGAEAAFDASGDPLREGLAARPDLIKPNAREVSESLGFHPRSDEDVARALALYHDAGVETVVLSLGGEGLAFSRGGRAVRARVAVDRPLNSVGSGDAALAGALAGTLGGLPDEDVAALACAAGAANTLVSGACVFRLEDVERLFAAVELRAIS